MATTPMSQEKVWVDKASYDKAERQYYERLNKVDNIATVSEIADNDLSSRMVTLEKDNRDLRNTIQELKQIVMKLESRLTSLEGQTQKSSVPNLQICPQKPSTVATKVEEDDIDLFGSDSEGEDEETAKIREERLAAYTAKKSKKPALIAKSNIILDVKPWGDTTDMKMLEQEVRKIVIDGLLWGAAKLVPLAYGIHKLQISCVVEDDKVSVDELTEQILEIETYIQSVDIAAFNKV